MTPTSASAVDLELGSVQHTSRIDPACQTRSEDEQEQEPTDTAVQMAQSA